jgi:hypothetical protein
MIKLLYRQKIKILPKRMVVNSMNVEVLLNQLNAKKTFDRETLFETLKEQKEDFSINSLSWVLNKLLSDGNVIRIARNHYKVVAESERVKRKYSPLRSEKVNSINSFMQEKYPLVKYCVWETVQLNEFLNHQIAHNIIVVEVENMLENAVFSALREKYDKNVLLKPNSKELMYYKEDDTIAVMRLISEAPVNANDNHSNTIEKLIIDFETNMIMLSTISPSEYDHIYYDIFEKYIVDESKLIRYARRRNAQTKVKKRMVENCNKKTWYDK